MSPTANQSQTLDHTQAHESQPSQSSETAALDVAQPAESPLPIADSPVVFSAPSEPTSSGATASAAVDAPSDSTTTAFLDAMTTEILALDQETLPPN